LNIKMGAAQHRLGRTSEAARHFDRAVKMHAALAARGSDDPFTRYYIANLYALRGDRDKAFESLERVSARFPELTAARMRRDPDLESLRDDPRWAPLVAH
jgi:hypothetical protein